MGIIIAKENQPASSDTITSEESEVIQMFTTIMDYQKQNNKIPSLIDTDILKIYSFKIRFEIVKKRYTEEKKQEALLTNVEDKALQLVQKQIPIP